jgi:anaerobic ribonucleoside-triphosphate reductase activating protein
MHYHNITKDDMLNGDGLRVVLWTAGCSHGCKGCHNPITWDPNGGLPFDDEAKKEIFTELDKDYISGITLSGGDPLYVNNKEQIEELAEEIKAKYPTKTIWLYTGYLWEDIKDLKLLKSLDVVVDGKFELDKKDNQLHWRGSSNQRVIDVAKSRESGQIVLHSL